MVRINCLHSWGKTVTHQNIKRGSKIQSFHTRVEQEQQPLVQLGDFASPPPRCKQREEVALWDWFAVTSCLWFCVQKEIQGLRTSHSSPLEAGEQRCVWPCTHCAAVADAPQYWEAAANRNSAVSLTCEIPEEAVLNSSSGLLYSHQWRF